MASDEIRLDLRGIERIERATRHLADVEQRLQLDAVGGAIGEVEQALGTILGNLETVGRVVGAREGTAEYSHLRQGLETIQGALSGAERGLQAGVALGAFVPIPGASAVLGLAGGALGGYAGYELGRTQEDRRRQAAALLQQEDNRRFAAEQAQAEALRQAYDPSAPTTNKALLEEARARAARRRAQGGL